MLRQIVDWLDQRTGIERAIRHFLYEDIPASAGWHQVLGSVALFCFMTQAFTGVMLAFNYAPTPGDAHNSLRYIMNELTGGSVIRGLHHWGASMMIVIVVLHMVQVFVWGAYKKPREVTWMVGVVLLMITLAFGLTGYLLPWDNRAYWGTVVTTQIAAKAPGLGPYMLRLMGSEDGTIGVVTFARFYALHVMLLPPLLMGLIGVHVYLVRKHGVAPAAGDNAPKKKFFPEQVFKDTVAIFAAFMVLVTLAVTAQAPLGRLADPTDTSYIPRPEWYFLFLFQTLKFFEGPLEIIGSMVLPGIATMALILVPFVDRGAAIRVGRRTTAIAVALLAAITWGGLTAAAISSTPKEVALQDEPASEPEVWQALPADELAGAALFRRENCSDCHQLGAIGKPVGPDLTRPPARRDMAWLVAHFKNPQSMVPGSTMPPTNLPDPQLNALSAFVLKLKPGNAEAILQSPVFALEGAMIYHRQQCGACHQVNGIGAKLGPTLNGIKQRRAKQWIKDHFLDPRKLVPGSTMPPYRFPPQQLEAITEYLLALPRYAPE